MTDLDLLTSPEQGPGTDAAGQAEFYLGSVIGWNESDGVKIQLDGQDEPMTKRYKQMLMCRPLKVGSRVVVMKQSGTYIVLGEVSKPLPYYHPSDLNSSATLADVISRCNLIIQIIRNKVNNLYC